MSSPVDGQIFEDVARQGRAIYDRQIRSALEPLHNGEAVAIHIDSGEYEIADSWYLARRKLRLRHPAGMIASFTIGPPSDNDFALSNRIASGQKP